MPEDVLQKLSVLFKTDAANLERLLAGQRTLIKKGLDRDTALKYVQAIEKTGAICVAEEEPHPATSEQRTLKTKTAEANEEPRQTGTTLNIVRVRHQHPDPAFSPLPCSKLLACPEGIALVRMQLINISYHEIKLISLFTGSENATDKSRLLVFTGSGTRPYIVDANNISFVDFPGVTGPNLTHSLRNFLKHLIASNGSIMLDEETCGFLNGDLPKPPAKEADAFSTSLAKALSCPEQITRKEISVSFNAEGGSYPNPKPPVSSASAAVTGIKEAGIAEAPAELSPWVWRVSPAIFAIAIVCFFLPFVEISCSGQRIAAITGFQLVTGPDVAGEVPKTADQKKPESGSEPLAILALSCAVIGLALGFPKGKNIPIASALCAAAGLVMLFLLRSKLSKNIPAVGEMILEIKWVVGFWLTACIYLLAAAFNSFLAMQIRK